MKKLVVKILCSVLIASLLSTQISNTENVSYAADNTITQNQINPQVTDIRNQVNPSAHSGNSFYCKDCGRSYEDMYAEYALQYDNIYYVNSAQKEMNDLCTIYKRNPYFCLNHHTNPDTGAVCGCISGSSNDTKYKKHDYYEENETPVLNLSQTTYLYTGSAITPTFTVTFGGKTIASSNYTYYISSTKDNTVRDYAYGQSGTKSVKDAGTYYLYVLFDPENTAGPNGTTFLGRLETTFKIIGPSEVDVLGDWQFSVSVDKTSFTYNGAEQHPVVNSVSVLMPGKRMSEADGWISVSNYTVSYSGNCKDPGNYSLTVSVPETYYTNSAMTGYLKGTYTVNFTITGNGSGGGSNSNTNNNGNSGNAGNNGASNGGSSNGNGSSGSSGSGSGSSADSSGGSDSSSSTNTPAKTSYSSEWVNGKWYNADGSQTYPYTMNWKCNSTGWWIEDTNGWYPTNTWQKINGKWYYFTGSGYMDYSEYRDGCWLNADGSWNESYSGGRWSSNATGWWYTDNSGWYPVNSWLWIDGKNYHFNSSGYCTNPY